MTLSFIHGGGSSMASYRLRVEAPARELGAKINDLSADVLVFSKPHPTDIPHVQEALVTGKTVIADICDDHFGMDHYREMLGLAQYVTCPTAAMQKLLQQQGRPDALVIEDSYEFGEHEPHCYGDKCLWFGHGSNFYSLMRVLPELGDTPLMIVSNVRGSLPWSLQSLQEELKRADIVILPATKEYKSPNRAVEAIRSGCFVVAEKHPSLEGFPVWQGSIREGIAWAKQHQLEANTMTEMAQEFVRERFSPSTQACAWRSLLASVSTWDAAVLGGHGGSTLTH